MPSSEGTPRRAVREDGVLETSTPRPLSWDHRVSRLLLACSWCLYCSSHFELEVSRPGVFASCPSACGAHTVPSRSCSPPGGAGSTYPSSSGPTLQPSCLGLDSWSFMSLSKAIPKHIPKSVYHEFSVPETESMKWGPVCRPQSQRWHLLPRLLHPSCSSCVACTVLE